MEQAKQSGQRTAPRPGTLRRVGRLARLASFTSMTSVAVLAGGGAVAQSLIDSGEMVAARRAFIDAYNARVDQAKAHPDPAQRVPVTFVSGGNLPQRHEDAHGERIMLLERAQSVGLLPGGQRQHIAAPRTSSGPPPEFKKLLLEMKGKAMPSPEAQDYE